jgi:hypothetical protein
MHILQVFQRHVASVCLKCFIYFRRTLQAFFILMLHMFYIYEYVQNVWSVSVYCCNKCLHVASCKCFIWMLHMFHIYVASVCSKCYICFRLMLHSNVSCFTCFRVSEVCSKSHGGTAWALGEEARRAGGRQMRRTAPLVSCGRGVLVLIWAPGSHPRGDRRGVRGKEWQTQPGYACRAGRGRWGMDMRVQQWYGATAGARARAAACAWRPDALIALDVRVLVIPYFLFL